jgi:hypothetical protein
MDVLNLLNVTAQEPGDRGADAETVFTLTFGQPVRFVRRVAPCLASN